MVFKKAREAVKRSSEPVVQHLLGGARWRRGDYEVVMMGETSSQSVGSHLRRGVAGSADGDASTMLMETWSKPCEGREVSYPLTKGRSRGLAKARSITEGRAIPESGNLEYMPGEWSRAKPPSAANTK